ncbi:MAG: hypothetical protein GY870_06520, partial [archaeon]|nr:hypothetical protein [archaeon]
MNEEITFKMCQDPIIKETRKAFLLAFSVDQFRGNTRYTMLKKWIPMSVILKIECNRLTVKKKKKKKE